MHLSPVVLCSVYFFVGKNLNELDSIMSPPLYHRYWMVLQLLLAVREGREVEAYQRYCQQWTDVSMLRLFSAFMESAPQLVFQLYTLIQLQQQLTPTTDTVTSSVEQPATRFNVTWTAVSAAASALSLGWGVAAYCHALRLAREADKSGRGRVAAWVSSLVETVWRFCLLAARVMAVVLVCLALQRWALLILCKYLQ
jgi:hypothetical protein